MTKLDIVTAGKLKFGIVTLSLAVLSAKFGRAMYKL